MISFEMISFRTSEQPKLNKPKEIRGIKRAFSVDYIPKKARCQCFIKNNDVFVKHVDYFSPAIIEPEMVGEPMDVMMTRYIGRDRPKKFIYGDSWGCVVLRSEAWIAIRGLMTTKKHPLDQVNEIINQQARLHDDDPANLICTDMERFWEGVVMTVMGMKEGQVK